MKNKMTPDHARFAKLTRIFIKIIRGQSTQESLSHELDSTFNIVSRWETGKRHFYWDDFLALSKIKKWDVSAALKLVTHFNFSKYPESHQVLDRLLISTSMNVLRTDFSNQKLNRLAAGRSKLLFSDLLLILERVYGRSHRFLNQFLKIEERSLLDSFFANKDSYSDFVATDPLLLLLHMAMSLTAYKNLSSHSNTFLAQLLNCSISEVEDRLAVLLKIGSIEKVGSLYKVTNDYVDSGAQQKSNSKKISNYWRKQIVIAAEKKSDNSQNPLSAYIMYSTNPALEEKIFSLCRQFYMDIKNLVALSEAEPQENIRYLGVDLFYPLGDSIYKREND